MSSQSGVIIGWSMCKTGHPRGGGGGGHRLEPLVAPLVGHLVCLDGYLVLIKLLTVQVFKYNTSQPPVQHKNTAK